MTTVPPLFNTTYEALRDESGLYQLSQGKKGTAEARKMFVQELSTCFGGAFKEAFATSEDDEEENAGMNHLFEDLSRPLLGQMMLQSGALHFLTTKENSEEAKITSLREEGVPSVRKWSG